MTPEVHDESSHLRASLSASPVPTSVPGVSLRRGTLRLLDRISAITEGLSTRDVGDRLLETITAVWVEGDGVISEGESYFGQSLSQWTRFFLFKLEECGRGTILKIEIWNDSLPGYLPERKSSSLSLLCLTVLFSGYFVEHVTCAPGWPRDPCPPGGPGGPCSTTKTTKKERISYAECIKTVTWKQIRERCKGSEIIGTFRGTCVYCATFIGIIWCTLQPLPPMYTEMSMYSEQEQNSICSQKFRHANECVRLTWHAKPFDDETDSKEHSKGQNEQRVSESYRNNRPVNLSVHVQDVSNFARFHFIGFMFHGFLGRQ